MDLISAPPIQKETIRSYDNKRNLALSVKYILKRGFSATWLSLQAAEFGVRCVEDDEGPLWNEIRGFASPPCGGFAFIEALDRY